MDQQVIIADFETRADAVGLAIAEVCRRAGVHPTTFSRWKASERNTAPTGANLGSIAKIEAVLMSAESVGASQVGSADALTDVVACGRCGDRVEDPRTSACTSVHCPLRAREAA